MIKYFFTAMLLVATNFAMAKDVYVSPNGNDNNSGTLSHPYKSIQRAINALGDGGTCYIREGKYREQIEINEDDIKLTAYKDETVEIVGTEFVSGWEHYKGEIYRANIGAIEPLFPQVLCNDEMQQLARYPDQQSDNMFFDLHDDAENKNGYVWLNTKPYGEVIFDEPLPGGIDSFKGGYFKGVCAKACENTSGRIGSNEDNRLVCDKITSIWKQSSDGWRAFKSIGRGKGYIVHLNALSREGEWFYEDGYLYFWNYGGGAPKNESVEVQRNRYVIKIGNSCGVELSGIDVRVGAICVEECRDLTIDKCSFKDIQGWIYNYGYGGSIEDMGGLNINGEGIKISNSYFTRSWGSLMTLNQCDDVEIDNCIFEDNGWVGLFTSAIANRSDNVIITNSTFGSTGRFHVRTDGHLKLTIKHCDFYDCMKMGQDAGSIQLTNSGVLPDAMDMKGSEFAYNKFHDMQTLASWSNTTTQFVAALYFEGAENYTVHHNLFYNITNSRKDGTFVYLGPRYSTIENCYYYNNTIWNIDIRFKIWNYEHDKLKVSGGINDMKVYNNIFTANMHNKYGEPRSLESRIEFKNNIERPLTEANTLFNDISAGDFTLKKGSPAIDAGIEVNSITSGHKGRGVDAGCYEYGVEPWQCGATLERW